MSGSDPIVEASVPVVSSPAEGMRMFIALLLKYGISAAEIEFMAKKNPAKLLDLD